jgi:hypothetical protein
VELRGGTGRGAVTHQSSRASISAFRSKMGSPVAVNLSRFSMVFWRNGSGRVEGGRGGDVVGDYVIALSPAPRRLMREDRYLDAEGWRCAFSLCLVARGRDSAC